MQQVHRGGLFVGEAVRLLQRGPAERVVPLVEVEAGRRDLLVPHVQAPSAQQVGDGRQRRAEQLGVQQTEPTDQPVQVLRRRLARDREQPGDRCHDPLGGIANGTHRVDGESGRAGADADQIVGPVAGERAGEQVEHAADRVVRVVEVTLVEPAAAPHPVPRWDAEQRREGDEIGLDCQLVAVDLGAGQPVGEDPVPQQRVDGEHERLARPLEPHGCRDLVVEHAPDVVRRHRVPAAGEGIANLLDRHRPACEFLPGGACGGRRGLPHPVRAIRRVGGRAESGHPEHSARAVSRVTARPADVDHDRLGASRLRLGAPCVLGSRR